MARRLNHKAVEKALIAQAGIISSAAKAIGCHRRTLQRYLDRYPECRKFQEEGRDAILDICENKLFKMAQSENLGAIIFTLKTLGRERGYSEQAPPPVNELPNVTIVYFDKIRDIKKWQKAYKPKVIEDHRPRGRLADLR